MGAGVRGPEAHDINIRSTEFPGKEISELRAAERGAGPLWGVIRAESHTSCVMPAPILILYTCPRLPPRSTPPRHAGRIDSALLPGPDPLFGDCSNPPSAYTRISYSSSLSSLGRRKPDKWNNAIVARRRFFAARVIIVFAPISTCRPRHKTHFSLPRVTLSRR
jgi:hypothetical protein